MTPEPLPPMAGGERPSSEIQEAEVMKLDNILKKMKKTEQKIYVMEQTKIHERIEEKKREAAQQHSLQLSRNSRYFA